MRAAVEATVRSVKHPFPAGKLPVRGQFRVACMMIGSAAVRNARRIQRYLEAKMREEKQQNNTSAGMETAQEQPGVSILVVAKSALEAFLRLAQSSMLCLDW
mgnify:CR=1 FL=1